MKIDWKKILPFIVAAVVFIGFAMAYCSPLLSGKVLHAGDVMNWKGAAHEVQEYQQHRGGPIPCLEACRRIKLRVNCVRMTFAQLWRKSRISDLQETIIQLELLLAI